MSVFLAIHCFPFATLLVFWNPETTRLKGLRWFYFFALVLFYLCGAYSIAEFVGVLGLGILIFSTYFGFLLGMRKGIETRELIARGRLTSAPARIVK